MYKDFHDIPYNSKIDEAIVGSFSFGQLLWYAPALFLSVQVARYTPLLPMESLVFQRIHWAVPLIIAFLFTTVKHPKTNLTLSKYLVLMIKFKFKKRRFLYKRENLSRFERGEGAVDDSEAARK